MGETMFLQAAIEYLRRGWAPLPMATDRKGPALEDKDTRLAWKKFQTIPPDEEQLRRWARRWPGANVGIIPESSGLLVLDVDPRHGGDSALAVLEDEYGPLPATPTVRSGGGGLHFYFRRPAGDVRNSPLAEGVDIVSLVTAPPSIHPETKKPYTWEVSPDECPLADAPAWLVERVLEQERPASAAPLPVYVAKTRRAQAYFDASLADEAKKILQAGLSGPGNRNNTLRDAAFAMGRILGAGLGEEEFVRAKLNDAAHAGGLHHDTGGQHQIDSTIRGGLTAGREHPRDLSFLSVEEGATRQPSHQPAAAATPEIESKQPPSSAGDEVELTPLEKGVAPKINPATWPYDVQDGRMVYLYSGRHGVQIVPIADFVAHIEEEITTEEGEGIYLISGQALHNGTFTTEISAKDFSDERRLKAALDAAAGARDPVRAGMAKHLGPAIKMLTGDNLVRTHRYQRTGWTESGRFLLPGREPAGVTIMLPRKLPYSTSSSADLDQGLDALEALLVAMTPQRGAVVIAFALQAALAHRAGWRNERYALFLAGRTGTLKTSFAQVVMSLYGAEFMRDDLLVKWGEGATRNAIMAMATHAHDVPFIIDNFKPSTGGGNADFVNLVHNILEGGEKDRLTRAATLKDTRPVFTWPLITGEDVPEHDPATLARILIVPFAWRSGEPNQDLTRAQLLAPHLAAVGECWLAWLEGDEGTAVAKTAGEAIREKRDEWAHYLLNQRPDIVNGLRVATNLATNQLTWWVMEQHPILGELAQRYTDAHQEGIGDVARGMARQTAEALEATRFLEGLRQLIAGRRAILLPSRDSTPNVMEQQILIGWKDERLAGGAYILPDLARNLVERYMGPQVLGGISNNTLYAQLQALDMIAGSDPGRATKVIRTASGTQRTLWLKFEALEEPTIEPGAAPVATAEVPAKEKVEP